MSDAPTDEQRQVEELVEWAAACHHRWVRDRVASLAAALSSARAENERLTNWNGEVQHRLDTLAQAHREGADRHYEQLTALAAENAALRESRDVTAERAAGDRRALDEAQAKVAAVEAALLQGGQTPAIRARNALAALAAAQPTESAPR